MADLGRLAHLVLVDGDSESRQGVAIDITVLVAEDLGVFKVVEEVGALVVVDAEALLLDDGVRRAVVKLEACRERFIIEAISIASF